MGKSVSKPVSADELINGNGGDPVAMSLFKTASKISDTQFAPKSSMGNYTFDPHSPEYEYVPNATPTTTNTDYFNNMRQSVWEKGLRGVKQFGANVVASVGEGLANTFDFASMAKTINGEITGSDDNFTSSLFGLTTKEMQDWATGIAERNKIHEQNPGGFDPSNFGWWMNQFASAGTGVGMALEALGTTVAIEAATGGTGTAAALGKLGSLFNKVTRGAKGIEAMADAVNVAKGLRSAATLYGVISRYSESRMEASQNYDQIYQELDQQKNPDGSSKFSEEEKKFLASEGGRKTFNLNMALLPLDILGYRTMIFNPVSGTGVGLLEKSIEKIGNKWLRKGAQGLIFSGLEGSEEGLQYIAQEEGNHYAKVLGGEDDGSSFFQRAGKDVKQDEFWNNFAGGVLGSPIIAGAMKLANKAMVGNRTARINELHKDYLTTIGKMDNSISEQIKKYEEEGKTKEASILRRQFNVNKSLTALHLDAMTDKDSAFDSHMTFIDQTLQELNAGKSDALTDLGFNVSDPKQLEQIKNEFTQYKADSDKLSSIYNSLKNQYNKNFLPQITQQHFQLGALVEEQTKADAAVALSAGKLAHYDALTTNGKQIYDAEYELSTLKAEKARLTEAFRTADDANDKELLGQQLKETDLKISQVSEKVDTVSQSETYTPEQKTNDNDIINSAIKDSEHLNNVYDKLRLQNEISLQRRKIALWNDPKYQAQKSKEVVSKARTRAQVEVAQENATPEVQKAAEAKTQELVAQEAAQVIKEQDEEAQKSKDVPGNADLFADDSSLIQGIVQAATPVTPQKVDPKIDPLDTDHQSGEPEFLFSPTTYDFDKSSEDSKNRVIMGVRGLLDKLAGGDPSFEGLVRHVVKVQTEAVADNIFNALKYGWEKTGHDPVDYQAVYDKVFGNPFQSLMDGVQGLTIHTPEQLEVATTQVTEQVVAKQEKPQGFDNNNQPVYKYKGIVTNESSPKLAFTSRLSEAVLTPGEAGATIVSHDYTDEELNVGDYVDSLQLLDPDRFEEGIEMQIRVPDNYGDLKIPVYNADGSKGKAMPFSQYVAERNLSPEDQEYRDKLPMIIYKKGAPTTEKGVAFVHDIGWYHPIRFNQEMPDDMANAIANTREVREAVLNSGNKADIMITGKRQTTFSGLKTKEGQTISLKEANPNTQITVALTDDSLSTSSVNRVYPNDKTSLVNNSPFKVGQVLEVRRYGTKDGVKTYLALPVIKPKLDEGSRNSVLQAIYIYGNKNTANPAIRAQHDAIVKQIRDTMGLDILSGPGLEKYLKHFINTFNVDKAKTNEDVEAQAKAKLAPGTPYISFIAGGNIVFGRSGEPAFVDKAGTKRYSFFINPNSSIPVAGALANLNKDRILGWYEQNVNLDNLNSNKPVMQIGKDGTVSVAATSYNEYLLQKLQTNIKSYNIGTKENPNYVTNVQPVITYELSDKVDNTMPTNQEVREEMVQEQTVPVVETQSEDLTKIQEELMRKIQAQLGKDFGAAKKGNFSPIALTDEQREAIGESIDSIAGLTPDQQFDITDFMYNQVTAMFNLDGKSLSRADIDKAVRQSFDEVINPLKNTYIESMKEITDLVNQHPSLANSPIAESINDYQYRLDKIQAIYDNMKTLMDITYEKVAKYTNIVTSKVTDTQAESEDDPNADENNYSEDEGNKKEKDFWTDVLTENPENKMSYSMRRFFGQVRDYDTKTGEPKTGFLDIPVYVGSDLVSRTLMVTLADVPAEFDTMIAKLEERKAGIPWMQEVINKLKGANQQKKNQFVTIMANTSLRMKFTMISYNQKTDSWNTKVFDTSLNGVSDSVKQLWRSNFYDSSLVTATEEGGYTINKETAKNLIHQFDNWTGSGIKLVEGDMTQYREAIDRVKKDRPVTITPTGELLQWLKTNVVKSSDRVTFSMKGYEYQVTRVDNNNYQISFLNKTSVTKDDAASWLKSFGILLTPNTLDELMTRGLFHNYQQRKPNELFGTDNGLFKILYNKLSILVEKEEHDFVENGDSPLDESVINSLANLEAKYNDVNTPFGFRDGGKSLFALTAPKFINDRIRDLKSADTAVRDQLKSVSFSSLALWLKLLDDTKFRDKFQVSHMGLNAFREQGKKLYGKDNSIGRLSDVDHELTKLGMFWDMTQGDVSYNTLNADGKEVTLKTYPDSSVLMRMATVFSPTMSDKSLMTILTTAVLNLENKDLQDGKGITDEVAKIIYEQTVRPELRRMVKFHQNGAKTNISAYDKGAAMFLMMPAMNEIEYTPGLRLIDAIKNQPNHFTEQYIEGNEDLMKAIRDTVKGYVTNLTQEKLEVWRQDGLLVHPYGDKAAIPAMQWFDKKYLDKFTGDGIAKSNMAAMDFVVNSLISNANSFMLLAGDPAIYYKSKSDNYIQQSKDTFVNVGKRLANQIAPGTAIANSEHEKYIQIFLDDRKSLPEIPFLKFVTKINDGQEISDAEIVVLKGDNKAEKEAIANKYPVSSGYFAIEGSDAQEYTTWREHLSILSKLGKTSDTQVDVTEEDIEAATKLFSSDSKAKLTEDQLQLIGKVLQPIKPVYTGQIYDPKQDVMRTVYIKSSSFPLIPQLTAGMEIDKLREAMEGLESSRKMSVRASYQTANKVGALTNPAKIWDGNGYISDEALKTLGDSTLILDRKNFRIQQEVPFKSSKVGDDKITLGTQLMKLLFGDGIMGLDGFVVDGQEKTGTELQRNYNQYFDQLVQEKRKQLFSELGMDEKGIPIDIEESTKKLQSILKDEAKKRGYPLQDIEGLTIDKKSGQFNLPLWASSNSNRYESMLNSIITNRLIRMKFPGNSYVVGSEEGFRTSTLDDAVDIKEWRSGIDEIVTMRVEGVGEMEMHRSRKNRNILSVGSPDIERNKRGQGYGKQLYYAAIEFAVTTGGTLVPGTFTSQSALNVWRSLEREGLVTIENVKPSNEEEGSFEVTAKTTGKLPPSSISRSHLDKSKIIWTSAWNGKALQGAYHANGEFKRAQVLVASKFKNSDGVLIDMFEKVDGEYKYITQTDTGLRLKEDMFDKDLLKLLSFRIPTSGHQSASEVEIAGFLPYESADLMIVPRNFTKQKGLDFDVDKENTYSYWNFMNDNGKFELLNEKHRNSILARADKMISAIKNGETAEDRMIQAMFGDEIKYTEEDIKSDKFLSKLNSKITEKLIQNEIIKIKHAVMGSSNPKVQAKINKTLNTDYAEAQAEFIDDLVNTDKDDTAWTPLSDEYQKSKLMTGSSGKIGTGAYSLDVVGHSLFQQAATNGRTIRLIEMVDRGDGVLVPQPKSWRFGSIESDGALGRAMTLDGSRSISELQAERQNVAVDNEKLQIMGRVNLNDITMDVDKVFNMLGFDKGSDGNSISFLFLSQPIIKEYVDLMKNANANVSKYDQNKEANIIEKLIKKYDAETQEDIDSNYWEKMSTMMSNQNLVNAIRSDKPDGKLQGAILRRFIDMKQYGIAIRGIQVAINTDSKGLGKSFFDVIEKRNALNRLGMNTNLIIGASGLIGDYISKEELGQGEDVRRQYEEDGYVDIGSYMVKPDTLSGSLNVYGVNTAYNMWKNYFPYNANVTNQAFNEILGIVGNENASDAKIVDYKQDIFKSMRKYFSASKYSGIISAEDDINAERARLYIDSDTNTSLAKYLKTIKQMTGNAAVESYIKSNKLLNRFEYDVQKNGSPSLIKFNNAAGEEFDEQYLYESLSTLLEAKKEGNRIDLPTIGNKSYTLDSLAQDIIAYAYLGNSIQEAIQFTKYVPVSYLNTVGFSEKMRKAGDWLDTNPNVLGARIIGSKDEKHLVSEFTMQYIQHNPEKVKYKIDKADFNKATVKIDSTSFFLKGEERPVFVSVYDPSIPKGEKKFRLYWFDGKKYIMVPVLGTFGMDEYQPRTSIGQTSLSRKIKIKAEAQASIGNSASDTQADDNLAEGLFSLNSGDIYKVINSIAQSNTTGFTELAKALLPYATNIQIEVSDKVIHNNALQTQFRGYYSIADNKISINPIIFSDPGRTAQTILHELVHALTSKEVNKYIVSSNVNSTDVKADAPSHVTSLVRLYNKLKSGLDEKKLKEVLKKAGNSPLSAEEMSYYNYANIDEFMAMALTNPSFQQVLNAIPYNNEGQTFLERFKQILSNIFKALGLQFDEKFTAAHAISNIFEVIERSNLRVDENPYQVFNDGAMNTDDSFLDNIDNELAKGAVEFTFGDETVPTRNQADRLQKVYPKQIKGIETSKLIEITKLKFDSNKIVPLNVKSFADYALEYGPTANRYVHMTSSEISVEEATWIRDNEEVASEFMDLYLNDDAADGKTMQEYAKLLMDENSTTIDTWQGKMFSPRSIDHVQEYIKSLTQEQKRC